MVRILSGVSLCFMLVVAAGACSSESTGGGQAGGGSNEAAGTGTGGSGGSATTSAGATSGGRNGSGNGGAANSNGGRADGGRAGGASVGGNGGCTPGVVTCVDADTAASCDEDTGELIAVSCVEDLAPIGITSTGCIGDATEGECDGDPTDPVCLDGALVFAICNQFTSEQFLNAYVNCFQDVEGLKEPVQCVAPFLSPARDTADCEAAEVTCFGGEGGAGGAGG